MGRLGDAKFGIVLSHCRPEHVPAVSKRFLAAVQSEPIVTRDAVVEVVLSTSMTGPQGDMTLSDLIDQAEQPTVRPMPSADVANKRAITLGARQATLTGGLISPKLRLADE
jgi:GGDEF domain-containing protein